MKSYGKFWVALLGAVGVGLVSHGVIDAGQSDAIVNTGVALLTAFGVRQVPNS